MLTRSAHPPSPSPSISPIPPQFARSTRDYGSLSAALRLVGDQMRAQCVATLRAVGDRGEKGTLGAVDDGDRRPAGLTQQGERGAVVAEDVRAEVSDAARASQ